jgi:hypothetical protein
MALTKIKTGSVSDSITLTTPTIDGVLTANGGAVFNEASADVDFRVESDNNTHALFVDGGNNLVGIGTDSPNSYYSKKLVVSSPDENGITIVGTTSSYNYLMFADGTSGDATYRGYLGYDHADDSMVFATAASNRLRIDSSGRVGLGVTPSAWSSAFGSVLQLKSGNNPDNNSGGALAGSGTDNFRMFANTYYDGAYKKIGTGFSTIYEQASGNHIWYSNASSAADATFTPTERMRVDATSGNVLVGKPSSSGSTAGCELRAAGRGTFTSDSSWGLQVRRLTDTGHVVIFYQDAANVGNISVTGSATSYNTSSDYRLKTDAQPMTGASARVQALNPVNFEWIADGSRTDGFLAHEAQEVVPECATGTKDAMRDEEYEVEAAVEEVRDEDDNVTTEAAEAVMGTRSVPDMQGIDQSKLVPLLVAALQEAIARIEILEGA